MLSLLQIPNFAMALEYGSSRSSQNSMHKPAMVLKLAPAREYKFKLSPPSFFTSQHMLKISPGKDIANTSCLLPGLLCLGWDDEDPMLSLLCLYRKIYYHYIIPDHLRPRYETSIVVGLSVGSICKPSLPSTLLLPPHHTFENFAQKSSSSALCLLFWPLILKSSAYWSPMLSS
jgi:hypothetical protein